VALFFWYIDKIAALDVSYNNLRDCADVFMNTFFNSSYGFQMSLEQVVQEVVRFMEADRQRRYKLIIGTDSDVVHENGEKQRGKADFVTAIVIHRVGNGGRYFWRRIPYQPMASLRQRMYQEVMYSLEIAKTLFGYFRQASFPFLDFEIHVDVGENGETKTMIQELVSMIRANNFEAKTKPESYAATKVADRHV